MPPSLRLCFFYLLDFSSSLSQVDAIGGSRFSGESNSDNEVQRTMLQIVTELDGFDARGNIKVNNKGPITGCDALCGDLSQHTTSLNDISQRSLD